MMDSENTTLDKGQEIETLSDEELLKQYDEAEEDSDRLQELKEELAKRGFSFEADEEEADSEPGSAQTVAANAAGFLRYSALGTMLWELIYLALGLAGGIYFLVSLSSNGVEISTKMVIYTALAVLFIVSMGALAGAVRRLANQKGLTNNNFSPVAYFILSFFWVLATLGAIYNTGKTFVEIVEDSFKYALLASLMPLMGVLISLAFTSFFYTISREGQS